MEEGLRNQLRKTLQALRAVHGPDKVNAVAAELVRLGGGDAADLLQIARDRSLEDHDPGDPREN